MFSSLILGLPVLVALLSPAACQKSGPSILYSVQIAWSLDLEPDIQTNTVLNGTILVRAVDDKRASEGDSVTGFYTAIQEYDLRISDGKSNSIHASNCASYKTFLKHLKIPFVTYYENGLLKYIEVSKEESTLSANAKLLSSYMFNINTDLTFVKTKTSSQVSGTSTEFCEYGTSQAKYNVKKSTISNGYDILVNKQMDSSSTKSLSWIQRPGCSTAKNIKFAWNLKDTMSIQNRNGIATAPKTVIDEQATFVPFQNSANKISFKKSSVIIIKSALNTSLTTNFSNGSKKITMIESVKESLSEGSSNPRIRKVTEALACGPPAMYGYYGLNNLALRCDKA